jgi:hypothetical protein
MKSEFVFFLQGRLGNQMWGLSEAYRLHKFTAEKINVVVSNQDSIDSNVRWYKYLSSQPWLRLVNDDLISKHDFHSAIGVGEDLQKAIQRGNRHFRGFTPKYSMLLESGQFPFQQEINYPVPPFVSIGVRRDDYWQNPHLGILPKRYYRLALSRLEQDFENLDLRVFGIASARESKYLVPNTSKGKIICHLRRENPIHDLELMSRASYAIISNSTFSYLGSFFSKSKRILMPEPFYLKIENWERDLKTPRTELVRFSNHTELRYLYLRIYKRILGSVK